MVKAFFPKAKKMVNVTAMDNETRQSDEQRGALASQSESSAPAADIPGAAPGKTLSAEAIRALQEAEARRQAAPSKLSRRLSSIALPAAGVNG